MACVVSSRLVLDISSSLLILLLAFMAFWKLFFLRDPKRNTPPGKNIVSPADGKVMEVIRIPTTYASVSKGMLGKFRLLSKDVGKSTVLVSIFMSPLDVHINRSPIDGKVAYARHIPGKFFAAFDFEKSMQNERNEVLIQGNGMRIKVVQVAGFVARRIECFVKKGDILRKGQRYGLINLGSQLNIIMPSSVKIMVEEGDRVRAGESILAVLGRDNAK